MFRHPASVLIITSLKLFLLFTLYCLVSSELGGLGVKWGQLHMEFPLILLSSLAFFYLLPNDTRFRSVKAISPWLVVYLFMDMYFWTIGRVFKWVDIQEFSELMGVLPLRHVLIFFAFMLLIISYLIWVVQPLKKRHLPLTLAPVVSVFFWSIFAPASFASTYENLAERIVASQEARTVAYNGRWVSTLYFESHRRKSIQELVLDSDWFQDDIQRYSKRLQNVDAKRNIHIIVLESFIDPTLLTEFTPPADYLSPWMQALLPYRNYSQSPVFGGSTPQAEFEILCNAPAYASLGTIEFNSFTGSTTSCLPAWFREAGWQTVAHHAYRPTYFNRPNAYQSVGFQDIQFPVDYLNTDRGFLQTKLEEHSGPYMYDGDFFEQVISNRLAQQSEEQTPMLNYLLGVYGHFAFPMDADRHPEILKLDEDKWSEYMSQIINQYYYRIRALEAAVKQIYQTDSDAIVLAISDHLPPLGGAEAQLEEKGYADDINGDRYTNVYYLWDKGEAIKIDGFINHYQMAELIFNRLEQSECVSASCITNPALADQQQRYEQLMAKAIRLYERN